MVLADDAGLQDAGGRGQRVHGRVDTLRGDGTVELGGRIQVGEGRRRSRVGVVVRRHVDGLQRGDRTALGRGDSLLEHTHLVSQGRLVTHGGGHTAQQRGNLGTGLGETEDVVDEQQHVLVLDIAEVLRHGQTGQGHAHTDSRGLVHLAEDKGGVLEDAHLFHLQVEVGALTGTLADAGEHGGTGEVAGDTGDHLLDEHRLAHTGAAEQADLAALDVRGQQIDDLDAGFHELGATLELVEGGGFAVDTPLLTVAAEAGLVDAVTEGVEHVALDDVSDGNGDRLVGVDDLGTADEAVGRGHGDTTDDVVTQVLGDLENDGLGHRLQGHLHLKGVVQCRQGATRELHVNDRSDDSDHATGSGRCGAVALHLSSCSHN